MNPITDEQITEYVEANIGSFHEKRLESLNKLKLDELLARKNPYLFRSKNVHKVSDFIKLLLDAHLSSQEETLFGDFLEGLAIHVAEIVHGGWKSTATGIDLEFSKDQARYIISIKSGPNWGNSSQVNKLKDNFSTATRVLRQSSRTLNVIAVNGCCYGRESNPDKGSYHKLCGQEFWELISNDQGFYTRIIEPLAHDAKQRNVDFLASHVQIVNRFCLEFSLDFCDPAGVINWKKLVEFTSATEQITSLTPLAPRPVTKRNANKLLTALNICNILRYWGEEALAERVLFLTSNQGQFNLASLRGFLLFWSAVESEGTVSLDSTPEGLLAAEWKFPDQRSVKMTFSDIDHVTLTAIDAEGKAVPIRKGGVNTTRQTATKRLIEHGLFVEFEGNQVD